MSSAHTELWNNLVSRIKGDISEQVFNAWLAPIVPISCTDNKLKLGVPNEFFKNWVLERYADLLTSNLSKIVNTPIGIEFIILEGPDIQKTKTKKSSGVLPQEESELGDDTQEKTQKGWFRSVFPKQTDYAPPIDSRVNPRYTFDDFVVGPSNRFAHAASMAIAESPAKAYNPLFIYGGVGLGKTHLMHAMGNALLKKSPKTKILYISSEEFTNQLISAIQKRTTADFRKRYRYVDVLLIDDIQFIAGKESTQEEFFNTFNSLYDAHKQIVLSSDRAPKEISTLEERLVSRLEWGLITDIQAPDFETRMAILKKKSEKETVFLPENLFYFLAENIKSNIRELEGALIRVTAYAKLMNKNISVDLAKEVLKGMIIEGEKKINIDLIQKRVAKYFDLDPQDMKAKKRTRAIAYPRQIAMFLSRELTDLSLPQIGGSFGGRDHTTVLHACEKIETDMKKNEKARWVVEKIRSNIKG